MRRAMLLPLAMAASATVLMAGLPAAAGAAPSTAPAAASATPPPTSTNASTRDISAIARAERLAATGKPGSFGASGGLRMNATTGSYQFMADTYAVGKTIGAAVDTQRGVAARAPLPASKVRRFGMEIWYPATGVPISSGDNFWAQAIPGRFPLIVFAHGFDANPDTYQPFLHALAAQGFIVAAPVFPIEASIAGAAPASRSNTEILNQMYDMSAAITQMLSYAKEPGNFLGSAMDPSKIGVIGHSDGGMTVAGMVLSSSYSDPRIDTAIVMAGAGPYGLQWNNKKVVPTMIEQATGDPYNPPSSAQWLFNHAHGPHTYLTVNGPYHIWPLIGNDVTADMVRRTVVTHLSAALYPNNWMAFLGMLWSGNQPGITSLKLGS